MFDKKLIDEARFYFPLVLCDDRVIVYKTAWEYETPETCHNDQDLKTLISKQEAFIKKSFPFLSHKEMVEFGVLYK